MDEQKKEPLALADASGSGGEDSYSSTDNSTTKSLKNQDYMDFTEEDPVEPPDPKSVTGKFWCFIVYPDSAPENWIEILNRSGLCWAMSPLHEHDLNADGSKKKPHYHVIIIWRASTTYNAVKRFTHVTLNATVPQVLQSPIGYYRYFTHEDNPEKYQYNKVEIRSGNGFDIADYAKMTKQQMLEMHQKLTQMIIDNSVWLYADACEMAMSLGWDEYECVTKNTIHFTALCKSVRYKCRKESENDFYSKSRKS